MPAPPLPPVAQRPTLADRAIVRAVAEADGFGLLPAARDPVPAASPEPLPPAAAVRPPGEE